MVDIVVTKSTLDEQTSLIRGTIARIRMIDFFNAEDSQAFEEEYVKVAGSLLQLATNLIMTRTSDESLLHIAIYNTEHDADASLAPIQKFMSEHQKLFKDTMYLHGPVR